MYLSRNLSMDCSVKSKINLSVFSSMKPSGNLSRGLSGMELEGLIREYFEGFLWKFLKELKVNYQYFIVDSARDFYDSSNKFSMGFL